jgi:hypothetical protein
VLRTAHEEQQRSTSIVKRVSYAFEGETTPGKRLKKLNMKKKIVRAVNEFQLEENSLARKKLSDAILPKNPITQSKQQKEPQQELSTTLVIRKPEKHERDPAHAIKYHQQLAEIQQ